jgi:hypothetical protein
MKSNTRTKNQKSSKPTAEHADAHNNLGLLLEAKGDLDAALSEYRAAINADPNHDKAYSIAASCWPGEVILPARQGAIGRPRASTLRQRKFRSVWRFVLAQQGELASAMSHFSQGRGERLNVLTF